MHSSKLCSITNDVIKHILCVLLLYINLLRTKSEFVHLGINISVGQQLNVYN